MAPLSVMRASVPFSGVPKSLGADVEAAGIVDDLVDSYLRVRHIEESVGKRIDLPQFIDFAPGKVPVGLTRSFTCIDVSDASLVQPLCD